MTDNSKPIAQPRFENLKAFQLTGIFSDYLMPDFSRVHAQWNELRNRLSGSNLHSDTAYYGVCIGERGSKKLTYGVCVPTSHCPHAPKSFTHFDYPASSYAVFSHHGHASSIGALWAAIYGDWKGGWGKPSQKAPPFEHYNERFDPTTSQGLVEIWVPIEN